MAGDKGMSKRRESRKDKGCNRGDRVVRSRVILGIEIEVSSESHERLVV